MSGEDLPDTELFKPSDLSKTYAMNFETDTLEEREAKHQKLAFAVKYDEMVRGLFRKMDSDSLTLAHATVGILGELGELLDTLKKTWAYGKPLDRNNIIEELGDIAFYLHAYEQTIFRVSSGVVKSLAEHYEDLARPVQLTLDLPELFAVMKALNAVNKATFNSYEMMRLCLAATRAASTLDVCSGNAADPSFASKTMALQVYADPADVNRETHNVKAKKAYLTLVTSLSYLMLALEVEPKTIYEANMAKLSKRYPSGAFSEADAIARADKEPSQ